MIDPTGMSAVDGDYFNKQGNYLGSDGIDDNKIYISEGNTSNYLNADKNEVQGGLSSLSAIRTSLTMTNSPSNHKFSPDTKGGLHEVRFDIQLNGKGTRFTEGGVASVNNGIMEGSITLLAHESKTSYLLRSINCSNFCIIASFS
ncbi:hypothetical protein KO524_04040 [Flavobacterium sp. NKUCC04_CG]|nr:hypothetical protein [Flavobacterium sp. NKUCC04_CG]